MHETKLENPPESASEILPRKHPPSAARNETRIAAISSLVQPRTPRHLLRYPARRAAYIRLAHLTSPPPKSLALSLSRLLPPPNYSLFLYYTLHQEHRAKSKKNRSNSPLQPTPCLSGRCCRWGPPIGRWWGSVWRRKGGGAASNAAPPPRPCGAAARPAPGLYATLVESGTGRREGRILGWT